MNSTVKSLLTLSALGFVLSSPVEFKSLKSEIVPAAAEDADYRLSRAVLPVHYDLKITPYFENVSGFRSNQTFRDYLRLLFARKPYRT